MEQTTPAGAKAEIVHESKGSNGELNFLRFRQILQSFGHRNRNKRLWLASHIRDSLTNPWVVQQLRDKGGLPGENGHPLAPADNMKLSMERLLTIDPNNICLLLKDYDFKGEDLLYGTIETIDDGNGPGNRFMRNILQGIEPAVSCRSLVPQKKNPDGTTDVVGPGRLICYDRVFIPSHEEAFRDTNVEIESVTKKNGFKATYESVITDDDFTGFAIESSDNAKFILDGLRPALESASIDMNGVLSIGLNSEPDEDNIRFTRAFIPCHNNRKVMDAIKDYMKR
jgi:hypothetical protein